MSPFVRLSPVEVDYDRMIAQARFDDVQLRRRMNRARLVDRDDELGNHLIGVHGEHAFAKWLGTIRPADKRWGRCEDCESFSGTVNTFGTQADVGRYQVRTRRRSGTPLIIRESDKDYDIFVLVTVRTWEYLRGDAEPVQFEIEGWTFGREAKLIGLRQNPGERGAAWFVTPGQLSPMLSLPSESVYDSGTAALPASPVGRSVRAP